MAEEYKCVFDNRLLNHIRKGEAISLNKNLAKAYDDFGSLLHYAAEYGNEVITRQLISLGSEVNRFGQDNQTPLMLAALSYNYHTAKALLDANADMNITNDKGKSALQMAFDRRLAPTEIFQLFVDKLSTEVGIEKAIENLMSSGCTLYQATFLKDTQILELMLKQGMEINSKGIWGRTALFAAAEINDLQLIKWLVSRGADVKRTVDEGGTSALYFSASYGNKAMMEYLLELGANPNTKHIYTGISPLFIIAARGTNEMDECVEMLLQNGAIPQNSSHNNYTIFDYAIMSGSLVKSHYLVAQLAMLEVMGVSSAKSVMICNEDEHQLTLSNLMDYLEQCKQILKAEIFYNFSLVDLLTASDFKMRTYARNETLLPQIENICKKHRLSEVYTYYYKTLMKRIDKAVDLVGMENSAIVIICDIFKVNESKGYIAARTIVGYLDKKELEQLYKASADGFFKVARDVDSIASVTAEPQL